MEKHIIIAGSLLLTLLCSCAPPPPSRVIETPQTRGLKGWEKPYEVFGERYQPMREGTHGGFVEEGLASWYGKDFHGKKTSNGEVYNMHARTAAHKTLPLGVSVKVTNLRNGRQTIARVNDRGPFVKGRIIDLSYTLAKELEVVGPGTAPVRVEALGYARTDSAGRITYREPASYTIGSYSVQVGAFTVAANARGLAAELKRAHGHSSIQQAWVGGNLFYRVRAGDYRTLAAAETAREAFEARGYANSFVVAQE